MLDSLRTMKNRSAYEADQNIEVGGVSQETSGTVQS